MKQEARLELERLVAEGKEDLSLGEITGAFPFPLDGFQQQAVESFLKGGCRNNGEKRSIACVAWAAGGTKSLVMQGWSGWGRLQLRRSLCTTLAWRTGGQSAYGVFLWLEVMLYDRLATAQNVVNHAR